MDLRRRSVADFANPKQRDRNCMNQRSKLLVGVAAFCAARCAFALNPGDTVDNFRLLDHTGASRELYYLSDMKAVVLMAQGNGCEVVRKSLPDLQALRDKYRAQGVELMMINSNLPDSRDAIEKEAKAQGIDLPILLDETQLIGESLGLKRNGELLVVNTKGLEGRVSRPAGSRRHGLCGRRGRCAVHQRSPVKTAKVDAGKRQGCDRSFPNATASRRTRKISYEKTIAPMLIDNCVTCHRQGGIGPWQMTSYDMIKGFSADDSRSGAHRAHAAVARRPALQRVLQRPLARKDEVQDAGALDRSRLAARRRQRSAGGR